MRSFILASLALSLSTARAQSANPYFSDLYSEGTWCGDTHALRGVAYLRTGLKTSERTETYALARIGADMRSYQTPSEIAREDEFAFTALGFNLAQLPLGLTFLGQVGYSTHLNAHNPNGNGFDVRTGLVFSHDLSWLSGRLKNEHYGEAIYVHRVRNLLHAYQTSFFYDVGADLWNNSKIMFGPVVTLIGHSDTAAHDYNRYYEARLGLKLQASADWGVILSPQYVVGRRWQASSDVGAYGETRVLGVLFGSF